MSLLTKKDFQHHLISAKKNLEKHGELMPVILVHSKKDKKNIIVGIADFPSDGDKYKMIFMIGRRMITEGHDFDEAVMVTETWFTTQHKDEKIKLPVREQPNRQEAIGIFGRNTDSSKKVAILQPFTRKGKQFVYLKKQHPDMIEMAILDEFFKGANSVN